MAFRLNWDNLTKLQEDLAKQGFEDDTAIIVVLVLNDGTPRKSPIRFKNFLRFMWSLSEAGDVPIKKLFIQDASGKVLYRQKQMNAAIEDLPEGEGGFHITAWNELTQREKDLFVELTIAQINAHGR